MIAVTFALPEESKDLRKLLGGAKMIGKSAAGPRLRGRLAGSEIVVVHTGMGMEAAAAEARWLVQTVHPKLIISSGFAGALSRTLRVGDVVYDARTTALPLAISDARRWFAGSIATAAAALETPEAKEAFRLSTGALAVDMETASIAKICRESGTEIVCIRGISDAAEDHLPVPMEYWFNIETQKPRPVRLISYLARRPSRIAAFAHFLAGLPKARIAMTEAIAGFIRENCGK